MYNRIKNLIINTLYPEDLHCAGCKINILNNSEHILCDDCYATFCNEKEPKHFKFVAKNGDDFDVEQIYCDNNVEIITFFNYTGVAKALIISLKFSMHKFVSIILANAISFELAHFNPDAICAVPISKNSKNERGFNQSELIAKELSKILNIPYFDNAIVRNKKTRHQVGLNKIQRLANVKNAFICNENFNNIKMLIIDDVFTTGATLYYCKQALEKSGANVIAASVCYDNIY